MSVYEIGDKVKLKSIEYTRSRFHLDPYGIMLRMFNTGQIMTIVDISNNMFVCNNGVEKSYNYDSRDFKLVSKIKKHSLFKIKNNKIRFNKTLKLSKRKQYQLKTLDKSEQNNYLLSLMGLKSEQITFNDKLARDELKVNKDELINKKPKSILHKLRTLYYNRDDMNHKPLGPKKDNQWVGIEIECLIPSRDSLSDVHDMIRDSFADEKIKRVSVRYDGSLTGSNSCDYCDDRGTRECYNCEGSGIVILHDENNNNYEVDCAECCGTGEIECQDCDGNSESVRGVEICLLMNLKYGFEPLKNVCDILNNYFNATVDTSCGLHIHLDRREFSYAENINTAYVFEKFLEPLSKLVPNSRIDNTYCKLQAADDKYSAINMDTLDNKNTLEIRLHSGSTNYDKIKNWIKLLKKIELFSSTIRECDLKKIKDLQKMFKVLKLDNDLQQYCLERYKKFQGVQYLPSTIFVKQMNLFDQPIAEPNEYVEHQLAA